MTAVPAELRAVFDWLVDGARSAREPQQVLAQLCERLVACGVPLWRVGVFVRTLHPQVMGRRLSWREGDGVETVEAAFDFRETETFRGSPVTHVSRTGAPLRRRLCDPACPRDFAVLDELRADGVTDYLVSPLIFSDGEVHVVTCSTRRPGGFEAAQAAAIEAILPPLARVTEIYALRRTAANLLATYVGKHAGERVFAGRIRRGDTEAIDAAIWFSDMRGSTALADLLSPQAFIDHLNRFFDCQVPAIVEHGGEVLKYIGDGLLAIFPIAEGADAASVCRRALQAAQLACAAVAALPSPCDGDDTGNMDADIPRIGLALHLGRVLYGNIGSGSRLDFTCIGPVVNLAARLEGLAGDLRRTIVASSEFAGHCGTALAPLGDFHLAGFATPQSVYIPRSPECVSPELR